MIRCRRVLMRSASQIGIISAFHIAADGKRPPADLWGAARGACARYWIGSHVMVAHGVLRGVFRCLREDQGKRARGALAGALGRLIGRSHVELKTKKPGEGVAWASGPSRSVRLGSACGRSKRILVPGLLRVHTDLADVSRVTCRTPEYCKPIPATI